MGTPIPPESPPFETGEDCPACFAPGKTPKFMLVYYIGIQKGPLWHSGLPDPPNGIHVYEVFAPCMWYLYPTPLYGWYGMDLFNTSLNITYQPGSLIFGANIPGSCKYDFENQTVPPNTDYFFGGKAAVRWLPLPNLISWIQRFVPNSSGFYEQFNGASGKQIYRTAAHNDGTNVMIRYDPTS